MTLVYPVNFGGLAAGKQALSLLDSNFLAVADYVDASVAGIYINNFRLTLTSGTPVTTADVTGASTIYMTPYNGNAISLYTGSVWVVRKTTEISLALSALTSGRPYDVFCYDNAGTPTLEFLAWTNDTTRATSLTRQDGVLVKSGDATRRYLGSFYTTGTTTTEDSSRQRLLYNDSNTVARRVLRKESTASWTYTLAAARYANNNSLNSIKVMVGVAAFSSDFTLNYTLSNTSAGVFANAGIGLDSTSGYATDSTHPSTRAQVSNYETTGVARLSSFLPVGYHSINWIESSAASGTTTWIGGGDSGLSGYVFA